MDNKKKLKTFLQQLLAEYGENRDLADDESLVTSGLLDSQAILKMVVFLENEFGIDLAEQGFDPNDFDSLSNLQHLVDSSSPQPTNGNNRQERNTERST